MAPGQVEDKDFVVLVSSHLCIDIVCFNVFESKITFGDLSIDSDKKVIRSLLNTVKLYDDDNKPWALQTTGKCKSRGEAQCCRVLKDFRTYSERF